MYRRPTIDHSLEGARNCRLILPIPRDVVLFSTADWDHPFWTNKQRVAQQLAERGFRVLYVESLGLRRPTVGTPRPGADGRAPAPREPACAAKCAKNLWVASPLAIPWHGQPRCALAQRSLARRLAPPTVWTRWASCGPSSGRTTRWSRPGSIGWIARCWSITRSTTLSAAPHVPSRGDLAGRRATGSCAADVVFTTSPRLSIQRRSAWNPAATHYLPNVADFDHFAQARQPARRSAGAGRHSPSADWLRRRRARIQSRLRVDRRRSPRRGLTGIGC